MSSRSGWDLSTDVMGRKWGWPQSARSSISKKEGEPSLLSRVPPEILVRIFAGFNRNELISFPNNFPIV